MLAKIEHKVVELLTSLVDLNTNLKAQLLFKKTAAKI